MKLILPLAIFLSFGYYSTHVVTDKILNEQRVCSSSGDSCQYLIYGNNETYTDSDSLLYWKFNSSDVYGHIQTGDTCTFTVYGWRVPFLSWYRNIISYKCKSAE